MVLSAMAAACGVGFVTEGLFEGITAYALKGKSFQESCWAGACGAFLGCATNSLNAFLLATTASVGLTVTISCVVDAFAALLQNMCENWSTKVNLCDLLEVVVEGAGGCLIGGAEKWSEEFRGLDELAAAVFVGWMGFDAALVSTALSGHCSAFGGDKIEIDLLDYVPFPRGKKITERQARCTFEAKGYLWDQTTKRTIPCPHPRSAKQCCAKYAGNNFYYWNEIKSARILFS
ncbi:MAG: hypothetical protein MPJ24_11920 [Pirellulaceae bacterium]|nr:hypothetical protein [Pirellulaceae bacterium]